MDAVWVVTCPRAEQVRRLMAERGLSEEQAEVRISAQNPQEEKIRQATVVISNGGSLAETVAQVEEALAAVGGGAGSF
jgi:dephospho-CoA kinase